MPFAVFAGGAVPLDNRLILLLGSADVRSYRVGKTRGSNDPFWSGYGDRVLCYDVGKDNYSSAGVMPYGVATASWVRVGRQLYGFGGAPTHGFNDNTENVLQIATLISGE